jgi:tripartite-type tricarboxylate transporter receptor subunit TctC
MAVVRNRLLASAFVICTAAAAHAQPQAYPERPIRMVIPFAAGGAIDVLGRVVGQELAEKLGQAVIIDNRPGGGTILGTEIVARSPADGYTVLLGNIALAINPAVKSKLPYDTLKDLTPIALLATQSFAIAAGTAFPASSVPELIALAKKSPGKIVYGMAGVGSGGHIAAELFKSMAKIDLGHVGYKGGAQGVTDLIANQLPLGITGLPNVVPHMKAGRVKVLAITDSKRSRLAPEVPTAGEAVPGYEFSNWFGILAPRGTPAPVVALLEKHLLAIIRTPETSQKLLNGGFGILDKPSQAFAAMLAENISRYSKVVKEARIQVDF